MKTEFLTISEAAKYAKVNYNAIWYHIVVSKKLKAKKVYVGGSKSTWYVESESVKNLYYKTDPGEKQHVTKIPSVSEFPHIYDKLKNKPDLYHTLISNEILEAAVAIVKARGYKVYKPVISHEEV